LKPEQSINKFARHLDKILFNSKRFDLRDTITITGTPRSGTTWLMEILGVIPGYISLFEPLNPIYFPESIEIGFQSRKYIPPDIDWKEGENYLRKIFTGSLKPNTTWLEKGNYTKENFNSIVLGYINQLKPEKLMNQFLGDKLIVKSVRLNRLLPWISKRFQLRSMIFIIRHPCAVVASRFKPGTSLPTDISRYLNVSFPNKDDILKETSEISGLDQGLLDKLKRIKTQEELLAASWCLDNYIPLSYPKPYPWTVVTYEKLIIEGKKEIKRIFNEIREKHVPRSAFQHLKIPSIVTHKNDYKLVSNIDEQLSKWKKSLSKKQIENILKIVSDFGLDFYTEDLEPDYKKIGVRDI
jgi:hypothetical protein